jgi:hypothetical protein
MAEPRDHLIEVDQTWDGNGNDAAYNYFTNLAASISRQQDALYQLADGYHGAAKGAWELSTQIGNLLQAIADAAIIAFIAAQAGNVTMSSGVGPVIGYSVAAYQLVQIATKVNQASQLINTALTAIMGAFGGGRLIAGQGGDLSAIKLPEVPFALPVKA